MFLSQEQHFITSEKRTKKRNAYTEAFSGGVARGGSGYLSSKACVMTSESGTHFSSNFTTGTFPSALIFKNLETLYKEYNTVRKVIKNHVNLKHIKRSLKVFTTQACYSNPPFSCHKVHASPPWSATPFGKKGLPNKKIMHILKTRQRSNQVYIFSMLSEHVLIVSDF